MKQDYRKVRICHIIRHAQIAGTEKHVLLLAPKINREIFEVHVCLFEQGALVDRLNELRIKTKVIPRSHSIVHFLRLVFFLHKEKYDIVHCHSGGYACIVAKLVGCKRIVYTKHGLGFTREELNKRPFLRKLRDLIIERSVSRYIALTRHDREVLSQVFHINEKKIAVIYNGIDPSFVSVKASEKEGGPTIGFVGRLTKQKGISYLLQAIPMIKKRFGNLRVLITGSGEEESRLRDLSRTLDLVQNVRFLGYRQDVIEVINQMDVFVLPSVWEGFPYVLMEAMILKRPIVATKIFGIDEIIVHGKTGLLVEPRDPHCIADAVLELLTDKKKAYKLGGAACAHVLEHFTVDKMVRDTEQLYRSLP